MDAIARVVTTLRENQGGGVISPAGTLFDIGGSKLHLACAGEGTPTVILEAALGASSVSWSLVQPEVARLTLAQTGVTIDIYITKLKRTPRILGQA